jgi:hypothetical protein
MDSQVFGENAPDLAGRIRIEGSSPSRLTKAFQLREAKGAEGMYCNIQVTFDSPSALLQTPP